MTLHLFLAGDVMTGRGIDQILEHPGDPALYEPSVRDARVYVDLAERSAGRVPRAAPPDYIWGDALELLDAEAPDVRLVNLETAITDRGTPWPNKGIHYRMHPANSGCLTAARIDCCNLANNHVLDWSEPGLVQTLQVLKDAGIQAVGAGEDRETAWAPATFEAEGDWRLVVFGLAAPSSGVPPAWRARPGRPGVAPVDASSRRDVTRVSEAVRSAARPGDAVVVSVHWGSNWGYAIPPAHRRFARRLIDEAGVDVVHGHSSHHPIGMEVHGGRLILYGCGDLITDYEGIRGHQVFRPDLGVLYLVSLGDDGGLEALEMVPTRMRRFRLETAGEDDRRWLARILRRESEGVDVTPGDDGRLTASW